MSIEGILPIFYILTAAAFLALSLYLLTGRGGFLIAGYNTLPKTQKEKYDEKALCKAAGSLLLLITATLAVLFYGIYAQNSFLCYIAAAGMIILTAGGIIYMSKTDKFLKKPCASSNRK